MILDEDRLIDIETKLAHQEDLLSALNDAVTNQQAQIDRFEALCRALTDRVQSLLQDAAVDQSPEQRPPHY
jgi:SlyX protein